MEHKKDTVYHLEIDLSAEEKAALDRLKEKSKGQNYSDIIRCLITDKKIPVYDESFREAIKLMRISANNINQIAVRVHQFQNFDYDRFIKSADDTVAAIELFMNEIKKTGY